MTDAVSNAVDAATDALHRATNDAELAYGARFDRATEQARERIARADGATLSLLLVENLPADVYVRHLDALLQAVRDLAHAGVRAQERPAVRVASVWDVIEDDVVAAVVAGEMKR